jgi:hypothetical protein
LHSNLQKNEIGLKATATPLPNDTTLANHSVEGTTTVCSHRFGEHGCAFVAFGFALSPKRIASSHHLQMGVD